jgi:hypothetical protein
VWERERERERERGGWVGGFDAGFHIINAGDVVWEFRKRIKSLEYRVVVVGQQLARWWWSLRSILQY